MAKTLTFSGAGDDNIHYPDTTKKKDEEVNGEKAIFGIVSKEGMMRVVVEYDAARNGCWSIAPMMWDEDTEYPHWPSNLDTRDDGRSYAMQLDIRAPDDAKVVVESYGNK